MDELDLLRDFRARPARVNHVRAKALADLERVLAQPEVRAPRSPRRRWALAAVTAAAAIGAGSIVAVEVTRRDDPASVAGPGGVISGALFESGYETAQDVVRRYDTVVIARVVAVSEVPEPNVPPERVAAGEWSVGRLLTFKVDRVLWRRPGSPEARMTFQEFGNGWWVKDGVRHRQVYAGTSGWQEIGSQYVLPVSAEPDARFGVDTHVGATFPFVDGKVAPAAGQDTALAKQLAGATPAMVTSIFTAEHANTK